MEEKVKGAWLLHHTNKLRRFDNQGQYESIYFSGKAGTLLSVISCDDQIVLNKQRVESLAKASGINVILELPTLLQALKNQSVIDVSQTGDVAVLGVTSSSTLIHTNQIFESLNPSVEEFASIELAEKASNQPMKSSDLATLIADTYFVDQKRMNGIVDDAEKYGFVDVETLDLENKIIFNGNLFRRDNASKIMRVFESLSGFEQLKMAELNELLRVRACVTLDESKRVLTDMLFNKLIAVGLYDVSTVHNSTESVGFLSLPSAYAKYSHPMVDDAFDFAKALVSSLTYGMHKSTHERGQIQAVEALLKALINGQQVGPVRAIGEDYKFLELKGVVNVSVGVKSGRKGFLLKLLKKEVGELALQVIQQGDISEHSLTKLPETEVLTFEGPEAYREVTRLRQVQANPKHTNNIIESLRSGGIL